MALNESILGKLKENTLEECCGLAMALVPKGLSSPLVGYSHKTVRVTLLKIILLSTVGQFGKLSPSLNDRKKA